MFVWPTDLSARKLPRARGAQIYHQQYLAKNPQGYCVIGGCGVPFNSRRNKSSGSPTDGHSQASTITTTTACYGTCTRVDCWRRHAAGGTPYSRRNARMNAVSVW